MPTIHMDERIRAAQAVWELHLAILQEEERRLVTALEQPSRDGTPVPQEFVDRLKSARAQCNKAFQLLMAAIEGRVAWDTAHQEPRGKA